MSSVSVITCQAVTEVRALEPLLRKVEDFLFMTAKGESVDIAEVQGVLNEAKPKFRALEKREQELVQTLLVVVFLF